MFAAVAHEGQIYAIGGSVRGGFDDHSDLVEVLSP
jgi:hypothetical protein